MSEPSARLLQLILAGRPEPLTSMFLGTLTDAERKAYVAAEEFISRYALAVAPPVEPSASLRDRVLRSFAAKTAQTSRAAVLVFDMIRDHLEEGRALEVPRAREIVPALAAKLRQYRAAGTPVVYVVDEHEPDDPDLELWGTHALRGSGGNEIWPDLAPEPEDVVVTKRTYSAFSGSNLGAILERLGCDSLVLTGCLTEVGIMATAAEALQLGYLVEIPRVTQAGFSAMTEQVSLGILAVMPPYGDARRHLLTRIATAR